MLTTKTKERLRTSPERAVEETNKAFVATSPPKLMASTRECTIVDEPLGRPVLRAHPVALRDACVYVGLTTSGITI